ncbi:MAG: phosphoribosylformylglycinamidine synthase subunit PurQ [Candidatus Palauibacterales bacterium]|nr:phosphoribosylformylglycinamidine synthase subunit PurQ [Candidatus Palauibacterales bacterium]MDP2529479.1 phosphoribosylformylglycinamidine synthase subunit PurQ [Candidatus Palauibacterales bacterium]MDP2585173.1 phosphoribosylformylglycinamidine synthase subunit PurQ [Candidatus Palauibacterales bacterium]
MRFGIVRFPGSNCDADCHRAVEEGLGEDAFYLWHRDRDLGGADAILLPGGFAYGDYLRAGAIARFSPIMKAVESFARAGGPVLGICNGFQILCEAGLLPGALARNAALRFLSHDVHLSVERTDTAFTGAYRRGQVLRMPLSHGEGRFVADATTLDRLEEEGRVVFRYVDAEGNATPEANPNGSLRAIAGVCNEARNVVGLMPHPDRAYAAILGSNDGLGVFRSALAATAAAAS